MLIYHVQKQGAHSSDGAIQTQRDRAVSREHEAKTTFPAKLAKCGLMGTASVESAAHVAGAPQGVPKTPVHHKCLTTVKAGERFVHPFIWFSHFLYFR